MNLSTLFSIKKLALLCALITGLGLGLRTYWLYNKMLTSPTYRESIELVMAHKRTFLFLYKLKPIQARIAAFVYGPPAKQSVSEWLETWLEARIMYHIEHHPHITKIKQLPCLERNVLRALDGTSYVSSVARQGLYYVTRRKK